jgi:hypothetical protein
VQLEKIQQSYIPQLIQGLFNRFLKNHSPQTDSQIRKQLPRFKFFDPERAANELAMMQVNYVIYHLPYVT